MCEFWHGRVLWFLSACRAQETALMFSNILIVGAVQGAVEMDCGLNVLKAYVRNLT